MQTLWTARKGIATSATVRLTGDGDVAERVSAGRGIDSRCGRGRQRKPVLIAGAGLAVALLLPAAGHAATVSAPAVLPGPASAVALPAADRPVATITQGANAAVFVAGNSTLFATGSVGDLVATRTPFTDVTRSAAAADGSVALAGTARVDSGRRGAVLTSTGTVLAATGDVDEYKNDLGDIAWIRTTAEGGSPEATTLVQRRRAGTAQLSPPVTFPIPTRGTLTNTTRTTSRWIVDTDGSVLTGTGAGVLRAGPTDTTASAAVSAPAITDAFPIGAAKNGTVAFAATTTGVTTVGQALVARVHVRRGAAAPWETLDLVPVVAQRLPGLSSATNRRSLTVERVIVTTTGETLLTYTAAAGTGVGPQNSTIVNGVIVVPPTGSPYTTGEGVADDILSDGTAIVPGTLDSLRLRAPGAADFGATLTAGGNVAPGNAAAAAWRPMAEYSSPTSPYRELDAAGIHDSPSAAAAGYAGEQTYRSPDGRWAVSFDDGIAWRRSPTGTWDRTVVVGSPPSNMTWDAATIDNSGVAAVAYSQRPPAGSPDDTPNVNGRLVLVGGAATIPGTTPPADPGTGTNPGGGTTPPTGTTTPPTGSTPGTTTPGGTTTTPGTSTPTGTPDKPTTPKAAAATLSARRTVTLARAATRTFTIRIGCTAACRLTGRLTVGSKRIATVTARRTAAGTASLRVKLTASARKRLLKIRKATLRVVDSRGATRTVTIRVR